MDPAALQAELVHVGHRIGWGLLASAALALTAWKVRALTIGGAVVTTLMGAAIFSLAGFGGFLMFLAAATVAITSWRVGQKRRGQAIATHGAGSAAASCAVGVIGAFLMAAIEADATGAVILTAGVAAWASEAVAREFEKGYGRNAAAVATVMTSVTLAGLFALAFPALRTLAPFIVLGVAAGVLVHRGLDRYKSSTLLNDDVRLFANTIVAAAVAWLGAFIAGRA